MQCSSQNLKNMTDINTKKFRDNIACVVGMLKCVYVTL